MIALGDMNRMKKDRFIVVANLSLMGRRLRFLENWILQETWPNIQTTPVNFVQETGHSITSKVTWYIKGLWPECLRDLCRTPPFSNKRWEHLCLVIFLSRSVKNIFIISSCLFILLSDLCKQNFKIICLCSEGIYILDIYIIVTDTKKTSSIPSRTKVTRISARWWYHEITFTWSVDVSRIFILHHFWLHQPQSTSIMPRLIDSNNYWREWPSECWCKFLGNIMLLMYTNYTLLVAVK